MTGTESPEISMWNERTRGYDVHRRLSPVNIPRARVKMLAMNGLRR